MPRLEADPEGFLINHLNDPSLSDLGNETTYLPTQVEVRG